MKRSLFIALFGLVLLSVAPLYGACLMVGGCLVALLLWVDRYTDKRIYLAELQTMLMSENNARKDVIVNEYKPIDNIPAFFVADFWGKSGEVYLCPIREYNDSRLRDYAVRLTAAIVGRGWAEAAAGNQPAKWLDKRAAENHFRPGQTSVRGLRACDITPSGWSDPGGGVVE